MAGPRSIRLDAAEQIAIDLAGTLDAAIGSRVTFGIRPEHIKIGGGDSITARVLLVEMEGDVDILTVDVGGIETKIRTARHRPLQVGETVPLLFPDEAKHIFLGENDTAPAASLT